MFQNIYLTQWFYVLLSTQFFLHECENSRAFSIFASVCVSKQKANLFCFFYFLKERQEVEFWVSCSQLYSWHLYKYKHIRNSVNTYRRKWMNQAGKQFGILTYMWNTGWQLLLVCFYRYCYVFVISCVFVCMCVCDLVKRLRTVKNQSIILWIWGMTTKNNVSIRRENKMTLDISNGNITVPVHPICWQTPLNIFLSLFQTNQKLFHDT